MLLARSSTLRLRGDTTDAARRDISLKTTMNYGNLSQRSMVFAYCNQKIMGSQGGPNNLDGLMKKLKKNNRIMVRKFILQTKS